MLVIEDQIGATKGGPGPGAEPNRSQSVPSLPVSHALGAAGQEAMLRPVLSAPRLKWKLPPPKPNKVRPDKATHAQSWDLRHHLSGTENELLPKRLRAYFSKPPDLPQLKEELRKQKHMKKNLKKLIDEEIPPTRPVFISADGGPPTCPERHTFGGMMLDRDGDARAWNPRFNLGMHQLNEGLHPLHRAYFTQKSLFEAAPSQNWRRYLEAEIDPGVWRPIETEKPHMFPPLGV